MSTTLSSVDILILGAGWTSTFLIPLCTERSISYAATRRSPPPTSESNPIIKFQFDPTSDDPEPYTVLPDARTVLITFPITGTGASERLVRLYKSTRTNPQAQEEITFVQLGTTSIWDGARANHATADKTTEHKWYDRHSPFIHTDRAIAEIELLALSPEVTATVLNLSGLWGGTRSMRNWVGRVAPTKDSLKTKGSIHMIHGYDVSRAILAVHANPSKAAGQRWLLTDGRIYDWWDLASAWGSPPPPPTPTSAPAPASHGPQEVLAQPGQAEDGPRGPQPRWIRELMTETGVRALPRDVDVLGRALDSREFWEVFGLSPERARLEEI